MSTDSFPQLTDEQKQKLSARYGQAVVEEQHARDQANKAIAAHRAKERRLKQLALEFADVYQGRLPFPDVS